VQVLITGRFHKKKSEENKADIQGHRGETPQKA